MMNDMMNTMGGMGWEMMLGGLLVLLLVILGIAALAKKIRVLQMSEIVGRPHQDNGGRQCAICIGSESR